jgi:hypothetical protein
MALLPVTTFQVYNTLYYQIIVHFFNRREWILHEKVCLYVKNEYLRMQISHWEINDMQLFDKQWKPIFMYHI